jgi:lipopolysaccharide transport system permease protein
MAFFLNPLLTIWRHRLLLKQTTQTDIRSRYAGSLLGLVWLVLYPLLFLSCYAVIYLCIYRLQVANLSSIDYVLLIFSGLVPFLGFAEGLSAGVSSVTNNASLIRNTLFPAELLPVKAVFMSQTTQLVGTALLLIALACTGRLTVYALLLPLVWLLQIQFMLGLVWVLSMLNVYLRDLQQMIALVILLLMMVSPIAYSSDMVPAGLRPILYFNPLYYLIRTNQSILLEGCLPPWEIALGLVLVTLCSFGPGFWVFQQIKKVLADNV